jgi:hypothetical protein
LRASGAVPTSRRSATSRASSTNYATLCGDNAQFAKFNKIGLDAHGNPNADDLHAAWAAGARSFLLTPR